MLHFIGFLQFIVGLVVLALALVLNYDEGQAFSGWPIANILLLTAGAFSVFVIVVAHFVLWKTRRPSLAILVFHFLAFLLALATFVYCFLHFPYDDCHGNSSKGCEVDKAAVPMDGVLMGLFFISSLILLYDFLSWNRNGGSTGGKRRVSRFYY